MEFVETINQKLNENKKLTPGSIKVYVRNLTKLNDDLPLENFKFLENIQTIINKLKDYKDTTKRNYLICIVSVLSLFPEQKQLHDAYYTLMMDSKKKVEKEKEKGEMTETQEENWISWDKVKEVFNQLEHKIQDFYKKKVITDDEYTCILGYALLALYVLNDPRRNKDYTLMNVVDKYEPELDSDHNYYDIGRKKFIFNNYKTSKKYGRQDIKVSPELTLALKKYLKFRSNKLNIDDQNNKSLLIRADGKPLDKSSDITKLLNKIFGKSIGSSMLRHILLTDKYKDTHKEMEVTAGNMAHSTAQQAKYCLKPKGIISVTF